MLEANLPARCGEKDIAFRSHSARHQVVTAPAPKRFSGQIMRKMHRGTQQALLSNFSLGTRSFNTAQAAQPNTTAEVLHQWQQETERRQQLHAETHRDLDQPIHSRKAGNRRRRSQRLNIVQGPENPPSSNQHRPFALHTLQHQQQPALHDMPSKQYMGHSVPSSSQTVQPAQQTKSVRKQIQPKGTNLRSLATTTMLWSQADLLQQLQQVRAHRPDNGLVTESDRIQAVQMQSPATVAQLGSANLLQRRLAQLHTSQEQQDTPVVGHAPESSQHSVAQLDSTQQTGGAELDTMSLALDLVDNQLPSWSHKQPLDWSAQHNLSFYHPQLRIASSPQHSDHVLTKFSMSSQGEQLEVQPLWIAVHQEQPGGPARLYETVHSLQPEVLEHIPQAVQPFCLAEGMTFGKPQFSHGSWKGYLVGVVGDVAAEEDNVLWPNRMFCGKRVMHNVRNGWDIARFLAEPTVQDMEGHHANLRLLQEDRNYQPGWVWHMLKSRWGDEAVTAYSTAKAAEQQAAHQQASSALATQQHAAQQSALQQQARRRMAQQQRAQGWANKWMTPERALHYA